MKFCWIVLFFSFFSLALQIWELAGAKSTSRDLSQVLLVKDKYNWVKFTSHVFHYLNLGPTIIRSTNLLEVVNFAQSQSIEEEIV